ncbi:hypothetical protein JY651_13795 [Pyxidicoccus parkwayensis]|uniref:Peptidase S1 domain-containing protein n=1 Tax=Pyxidicoccus parkwayensis TaxID=2813578 RepID=A0ABX7P645_9BACT|nr:hypothetical protein [Pyxidicoccus parkwaysis]QSQ25933.1 hypothetical protein JY651_13795 [Pyxidicoccus parkwaysis]
MPALEANTHAPRLGLNGTLLRYTCGVTFISPSYAITAAHCVGDVDAWDPANQRFEVRMYDPMREDRVDWLGTASSLSGTFPNYHRSPLGSGYNTTSFNCTLVARCGSLFGNYQCPASLPWADTALLRCPEQPGCQYDYLSVATQELVGAPVATAWAHEVYSIPTDRNSNLWQHYTQYQSHDITQNYHYYDANELLPLVSKGWGLGRERVSLSVLYLNPDVRFTELHGCHGSSGSGIAQFSKERGTYELLGPTSIHSPIITSRYDYDFLCEDPIQGAHVPGEPGLGFSRLSYTRELNKLAHPFYDKCLPPPEMPPLYRFWLEHDRLMVGGTRPWRPIPLPWPCLSCPTWDRLRFPNEPMLEIASGQTLALPEMKLTAGTAYRLSLRVRSDGFSAAPINPRLTITLGGQGIVVNAEPVKIAGESAGLITSRFVAASSSPMPLVITVGSATCGISELVIAKDAYAPNDFEHAPKRAGIGIIEPGKANPVPATWTRGENSKFAALIKGGERFVATRQAFLPNRAWDIRFETSVDTLGVSCGLILADGFEMAQACNSQARQVNVRFPLTARQPVAFFIDVPSGHPDVAVDNLSITSL